MTGVAVLLQWKRHSSAPHEIELHSSAKLTNSLFLEMHSRRCQRGEFSGSSSSLAAPAVRRDQQLRNQQLQPPPPSDKSLISVNLLSTEEHNPPFNVDSEARSCSSRSRPRG